MNSSRNLTSPQLRPINRHYLNKLHNVTNLTELEYLSKADNPLLGEHIDTIKVIGSTGYLSSLVALIVAIIILTCVKKLRCPKNSLHLQLFISFIIRSMGCQMQSQMFTFGFMNANETPDWMCKAFTVIWQYSLLANYVWILMEGVYLHSLIFQASMSPYGPAIFWYIIFGWLTPLVFIIPWSIVRYNYENEQCWLINSNKNYFWILRGPITVSILLNFVIYIRIVTVLYSKIFRGSMVLQASKRNNDNNYRKLLRSTLVLIPLFGVHYTALLVVQQWIELNNYNRAEVVWMYIETVFSSWQGFIVACLYCFFNGEVHNEMKRLWCRSPEL